MSKSTKNILNHIISVMMIVFFVVPFLTQADNPSGGGSNTNGGNGGNTQEIIKNPFKQDSIQGFIETIVNDIFIPIGGVVATVMIIWAGFLYVTAGGNTGQIDKAHKALLWAVIGAAILLGAWVISKAIGTTIDQLKK